MQLVYYHAMFQRLFILLLSIGMAHAQGGFLACYDAVPPTPTLPEDLLKSRVVALFEATPEPAQSYAAATQAVFSALGIDVVSYGTIAQVYATHVLRDKYLKYLVKRQVSYVVLIHAADSLHRVRIVALDGRQLLPAPAVYYQAQAPTLEELHVKLRQDIVVQSLYRGSFLVLEVPTWLPTFPISSKKPLNGLPSDVYDSPIVVADVIGACEAWTADSNRRVAEWFKVHYPYVHRFTVFQGDVDGLYKQGNNYALLPVYGLQDVDGRLTGGYTWYLLQLFNARLYILSPWTPTLEEGLLKLIPSTE